jgi:hypothetical protein
MQRVRAVQVDTLHDVVLGLSYHRRLLRRMRTLELGMAVMVILALATLGASVSTNPFNLVWQLLIIFFRAAACLMSLLAAWLLVAVPVFVAKSADKVIMHTKYSSVLLLATFRTLHVPSSGVAFATAPVIS